MRATLVSFLVCGLLVVGSIVQACVYYVVLPERMASHFDAAGVADGWQSKEAFFLTHLGLVLGTAFVFVPLIVLLVRFGPASLISMPHKEYWLAETRERETRASVASYGVWAINLSLALIAAQLEIIYRTNVSAVANLGTWLWVCVAGFGLAMLVWVAGFYHRFRMPPKHAPPDRFA